MSEMCNIDGLFDRIKKWRSLARVGSFINPVRCSIVWDERVGATMQNEFKINGNELKFKQLYIYLFRCESLDLIKFCIKY